LNFGFTILNFNHGAGRIIRHKKAQKAQKLIPIAATIEFSFPPVETSFSWQPTHLPVRAFAPSVPLCGPSHFRFQPRMDPDHLPQKGTKSAKGSSNLRFPISDFRLGTRPTQHAPVME
jgi:hypothetical protein